MAKIIAICNQKGGVAKTTTAVNISAYLAIENKKTLLIDLDPQSNATSGVGIDKHNERKSIYHAILEETPIDQVIIETCIKDLYIAPSSLDLTGAEVELVNYMGREYRLKKALDLIKNNYDYIIIDCPPSLGILTINGLAAADSLLIPIQCEYYALEGLSQLMNTIKLVRENLNQAILTEGVLLTMADFRNNLTKEVIQEVRSFFGDKVYKTIVPRTVKLAEAPSFGKPIELYDKHSMGAKCYHDIVREMLGIYAEQNPQTIENQVITEEKEV